MNQENPEEKVVRKCKNCGMSIGEHSKEVCIHCGYINDDDGGSKSISQINIQPGVPIVQQQKKNLFLDEPPKKSPMPFLVISTVNLFLLMPGVLTIVVFFSLMGALADAAMFSMIITYLSYAYAITSVVAFIMAIINTIKKGAYLKQSKDMMSWAFVQSFLSASCTFSSKAAEVMPSMGSSRAG